MMFYVMITNHGLVPGVLKGGCNREQIPKRMATCSTTATVPATVGHVTYYFWLLVWNINLYFSIYWECHDPN
jgi:hypothetical protein